MGNEDLVRGTQPALVLPFFNQAKKQRAPLPSALSDST